MYFPTLTCGVLVFSSVSAPRRPPPPSRPPSSLTLTHTHSLTHSLTHSHSLTLTHSHTLLTYTHSLTHTHSHSPTHTHTHTHSHSLTHTHSLSHSHSLTLTHSHSLTHSLTLTHSHSLTLTHSHTHTHSLSLTHTHSLSLTHSHSPTQTHTHTVGVPGSPPLLRGRRGTMCTAKGSDVRPGFRWRPWVSAAFAWQAWDNVHCQGVGCTPRGSAGVPGSPPLLRGRRGTMCTVKGSDVRPGVLLASLGLRLFCVSCVAGVGQCVYCQGVGCTPRGSAGVPGSPPLLRLLRGRRGTMCTAKGSDVRPGVPLASLSLRLFCVAGVGQCALLKGSDVRPGVPLASLGLRLFCVAGVGQCALPTGSDVRPGVPLASLGLRLFCVSCVAGVGQCALPRGRMYAPGFRWRPWVSASFASLAWQAWDNVHCQGVGCTPRGSAGVPGSPPLLRGSTAKGSDVRPGVPLASLGLRLFCVAGVGQSAKGVGCTPSLTHSLTD